MTSNAQSLVGAADISMWSGAVSYQQWVQARRRIQLAIVGSWHGREANPHTLESFQGAQKAGLAIATYIVLNSAPGPVSIDRGLAACGDQVPGLSFVALDIEVQGVTEQIIHEAAERVTDLSLRPIVYTGRWFWEGHLGNPAWASDLPLWDSAYNGKQDLKFPTTYGRWSSLVGHQYVGTTMDLGFSADLSVFDGDWLNRR